MVVVGEESEREKKRVGEEGWKSGRRESHYQRSLTQMILVERKWISFLKKLHLKHIY